VRQSPALNPVYTDARGLHYYISTSFHCASRVIAHNSPKKTTLLPATTTRREPRDMPRGNQSSSARHHNCSTKIWSNPLFVSMVATFPCTQFHPLPTHLQPAHTTFPNCPFLSRGCNPRHCHAYRFFAFPKKIRLSRYTQRKSQDKEKNDICIVIYSHSPPIRVPCAKCPYLKLVLARYAVAIPEPKTQPQKHNLRSLLSFPPLFILQTHPRHIYKSPIHPSLTHSSPSP
jgi:hypothetical protein